MMLVYRRRHRARSAAGPLVQVAKLLADVIVQVCAKLVRVDCQRRRKGRKDLASGSPRRRRIGIIRARGSPFSVSV